MKSAKLQEFFDELIASDEIKSNVTELMDKSSAFFNEMSGDMAAASLDDKERLNSYVKEFESKINREFENICHKLGTSKDELEKMITDPSNFSKEEWEQIKTFQKEIEEKLNNKQVNQKEEPANRKKRKLKTRNWLTA